MIDIAPTELIPHREPMLFVDKLLEADMEHGRILATVTCDTTHLLYNAGLQGISPSAAIEIMAQGIGLYSGYADVLKNLPKASMGKLLSIKRYQTHVNALPINTPILIEAREIMNTPPIGVFECRLSTKHTLLAEAEITVLRED